MTAFFGRSAVRLNVAIHRAERSGPLHIQGLGTPQDSIVLSKPAPLSVGQRDRVSRLVANPDGEGCHNVFAPSLSVCSRDSCGLSRGFL